MKKLLIMAVAIAASVVANAAAVSWNSGTIKLPSGANAKATVAASLFIVDATTYATYAAYTDATKLSDDIYAAYKGTTPTSSKTSTTKSLANISYGDYSAGDSVYAVLLYTTTENEKDYWMGNYGAVTLESAQNVDVGQLANFLGGNSTAGSTAWSTAAVPEPTSGLLLLLGMAGLALKRKRA